MIHFQGVTKTFGENCILDSLDLTIKRGQITFIIGKSGEGKSVTIKHIMGLLKPDKGTVIVDHTDVTNLSLQKLRQFRRKFGMLFQHAALFDSMTVFENVVFPLREHTRLRDVEAKLRVEEVLSQVGLEGQMDKMPSELSTGQKKRVGLARALAPKPKILLYDEPTTGMDPLICEMIDKLIVEISKTESDLTSVVISHDIKAALASADEIAMLYKGQIILAGEPSLFVKSQNEIVGQFFSGKVDGPMEFL